MNITKTNKMKIKLMRMFILHLFVIITLICNSCTNDSQKNSFGIKKNTIKKIPKHNMLRMILTIPNKHDSSNSNINNIEGFRHLKFGMTLDSLDTRGWFNEDYYDDNKRLKKNDIFKIFTTYSFIKNKENEHSTSCFFFKDTLYKIVLIYCGYENLYNDLITKYGMPNHNKTKNTKYTKTSKNIHFSNDIKLEDCYTNFFITDDMKTEHRRIEKKYSRFSNNLSFIENSEIENKIEKDFLKKCKLTLITQSKSFESTWKGKHCYITFKRVSQNKYYNYKNKKYSTDSAQPEHFTSIDMLTFIPIKYIDLENRYNKLSKEDNTFKKKVKSEKLDYI